MGSIGAAQNTGNTIDFSGEGTYKFDGTQTSPDEISFNSLYNAYNSYSGNPSIQFEGTTYILTKVIEWSRADEEEKIAGFTFTPQYDVNTTDRGSFFVGDDNKLYQNASQLTRTSGDWDNRHIYEPERRRAERRTR